MYTWVFSSHVAFLWCSYAPQDLTPFFLRACKASGNFTVRSESKGKAVGGFWSCNVQSNVSLGIGVYLVETWKNKKSQSYIVLFWRRVYNVGGQRHSNCLSSEWVQVLDLLLIWVAGFLLSFLRFYTWIFWGFERLAVMDNTAVSLVGYEKSTAVLNWI